LSERIFQRYIPENPSHRYHPPRQLQIVDWHGENIRSDHPQWAADKRKLRAEGASNIRLQDAEFFSRNTAHLPYFTFYPIPGQPDEGIERHKDRIRSVEAAVIKATIDLGFETCNVLKPAPDWNLVGQS
jgi:hypothetical protein